MQTLSRRDFIKLLCGAGLGFGISLAGLDRMALLNNAPNARNTNSLLREASASHYADGSWTTLSPSQTVGIHAAYVWTGKIIMAEGSSFNKTDSGQPPENTPLLAEVYRPTSGHEELITMGHFPDEEDLFCCYQAQFPDGNILFAEHLFLYPSE